MPLFPFDYLTQKSFNSNVLIGNWFEDRCDRMVDKKAIVPGVYGTSICPIERSIYVETYKRPLLEYEEFREFKRQGFINKMRSRQTHFTTTDSDEFAQNMTTTTDIMYNIRPQLAKVEAKTGKKLLDKNEDMMLSHNRPTETGILQGMRCERHRELTSFPVTTYKDEFQPLRMECPRERNFFERCRTYKVAPPYYAEDW